MNFDEEEDADFSFSGQSNNNLATLFSSVSAPNNESLKYKPTKQPQSQQSSNTGAQQSAVLFFASVTAFKYLKNQYEPQGKLGLAIINSSNQYRILLYLNKTQPIANIKLSLEFKLAIQKNNYTSFYDETNQLWSILFDNEDLVASFGTNIVLCKCNLLQGNIDSHKLQQDLKSNDTSDIHVESGDSIEVGIMLSGWKDMKLTEPIENSKLKPVKIRLGKNKLPQSIEELLVNMKQGDRKLFVVKTNSIHAHYPNLTELVAFYDVSILRIKKNVKERTSSDVTINSDSIPSISNVNNYFDSNLQETRLRSDSIKEKTKTINDQLIDPKSDKAKLISRMARMGQQTLPNLSASSANNSSQINDSEEEWEYASNQLKTSKSSLILQQKQLQQQLAFQNQLIQANNQINSNASQSNQLALYNNAMSNNTAPNQNVLFPQMQQFIPQIQQQNQQQFIPQVQQQTQQQFIAQNQQQFIPPSQQSHQQTVPSESFTSSENNLKILNKIELLSDKLDHIKSLTQTNNQNLPTLETAILLQNIQRIVKENEQYKKDLFDKSQKIEEQNNKITDLLNKSQSYVEQSHLILEQKNTSLISSGEKTSLRILELEQDKMKLTGDLTKLTSQISDLNLEINKMQKADLEIKQKLIDVSSNNDSYKQNSERLVVENADLQTKLDTVINDLKKERQLRKSIETKLQLNEDEINEMRSNLITSQKLVDEKKQKQEQERENHAKELNEIKALNANEINFLKEKIAKLKSDSNQTQNEQIKQIENDLNKEWQIKMEKSLLQCQQKYDRQLDDINDEKNKLLKQIDDMKDLVKSVRLTLSTNEAEKDSIKQELDELSIYKEKYERLQSQALIMKERYENRIKELLDAEPDSEVISEEVKKLMNAIYKKLKTQIKPDKYYAGGGILTAMLKIIKMVTLQILHKDESGNDLENENDLDYFSEYIYQNSQVNLPADDKKDQTSILSLNNHSEEDQNINSEKQNVENKKLLSNLISDEEKGEDVKEQEQKKDEHEVNDCINEDKFLTQESNESLKEEPIKAESDKVDENLNAANKPQLSENDDEDDDIQLINDDDDEESNFVNEKKKNINFEEEKKENLPSTDEPIIEEELKNPNELEPKAENADVINSDEKVASQVLPNENNNDGEEFEIYQKEVSHSHDDEYENSIQPPNQSNSLDQNEEENLPQDVLNEENKPEFKPNTNMPSSKGLFDDDDEDDDINGLFTFDSSNKSKKPEYISAKEDKKPANLDEKVTLSKVSDENSKLPSQANTLNFSPPPLFDGEDQSDNDDNNIDWFK